ncbi:MAG: hypothetical protein ACHQ53_16375 [Polyangiales bacterium]
MTRSRVYALLLVLLGVLCASCSTEPATPRACEAIFDAIVSRELSERGFRDPELLRRKHDELHSLLASALARCPGKALRKGALVCIARAGSTEQIGHGCLR